MYKLNILFTLFLSFTLFSFIKCKNQPCTGIIWKVNKYEKNNQVKDSIPVCQSTNQIEGEMKSFSEDGELYVISNYKNGKKHGWETYYINNLIWIKQSYANGKLNGYRIQLSLHKSGVQIDSFSNNQKIGESFVFAADGTCLVHSTFSGKIIHDLVVPIDSYNSRIAKRNFNLKNSTENKNQ